MKSKWSYSLETPNLGQNRRFFVLCDLEIWRMTLKNNMAPLLCYFKLSASLHSHLVIQNGVTVRKRQIWVKIGNFLSRVTLKFGGWPWKTIGLCYSVNSNWSYSPETAKLGFDLCDLDLWPLTLTFCMDISSVIGNHSWKFHDDTMMET